MRGFVTGCAVGKVADKMVVDLSDVEDKDGQGDLPVAMNYNTGEITLLQCDGEFTIDEVKEGLSLAIQAIGEVYKLQREAVLAKYTQIESHIDDLGEEEE